ncbi:MAG: hypothetical protein JWO08_4511 [Verrucomicrobiaceae bacterium]|nr:hypothetical protein [Verrucomicrobiaceae bacterium]
MNAAVERLRREASQLPDDEREALVRVVELDLDSAAIPLQEATEVEDAWEMAIRDRVEAIHAGKARLIPIEDVEAELDAFVADLAKA